MMSQNSQLNGQPRENWMPMCRYLSSSSRSNRGVGLWVTSGFSAERYVPRVAPGREVGEEHRDRRLALVEHQIVGGRIDLGLARRILAADDDALAARVTEIDQGEECPLLRQHAAGQDEVGPVEERRVHLSHVEIEETDVPLAREQGRDGDEPEGRRRIACVEQLTDFTVVPVAELREPRGDEQALRQRRSDHLSRETDLGISHRANVPSTPMPGPSD